MNDLLDDLTDEQLRCLFMFLWTVYPSLRSTIKGWRRIRGLVND